MLELDVAVLELGVAARVLDVVVLELELAGA